MQQNVLRKKKKVASCEKVIAGVNKRLRDLTNEGLNTSNFSETLKELLKLQNKGGVHQYPGHIRKFALTLHFYSAQAYRYVFYIIFSSYFFLVLICKKFQKIIKIKLIVTGM